MTDLRPLAAVLAAVLAPTLVACGSSYEEQYSEYSACLEAQRKALAAQNETPAPVAAKLVELDSASLDAAVRDRLKLEARARLDSSRIEGLAYARCRDKQPTAQRSSDEKMSAASAPAPAPGAPTASSAGGSGGGASQVSGTNNQVAGVDEADFVKNDDKYIYIASGSSLRIIQAWPAAETHEIARVALTATPKKLFVFGDRAVVFSSDGNAQSRGGSRAECTYGYDCVEMGDGQPTLVSIYDITNRSAPTLVRELRTSSSLITARRVGNVIHAIVSQGVSSATGSYGYGYGGYGSNASEADVQRWYDDALQKAYVEIERQSITTTRPTVETAQGPIGVTRAWQSPAPSGVAFTSVLSFDLAGQDTSFTTVLGQPGTIYASADAIYMASSAASSSFGYGYRYGRAEGDRSLVHKFAIGQSALATEYRASGMVKGHPLNQFAMDESEGRLRIATTSGHVPDPNVASTLSVMEEEEMPEGRGLAVVGSIDGIAKTEDIRSVRFDGNRAYVVTFKKTDPLFAFDLSNPRAPRMLGELKIPGFSTYMHMMDETHLLTIGYDAADHGSFAYFTGVMLQIFDVTDPASPKLTHKELIGTRGSSSEALANHLAFNYFAPKNLLALPMSVCEGGDTNGGYGSQLTFSGLMVYDVTTQGGFSMRGKVSHPAPTTSSYSGGCYNWWTHASSEVQRSIIMDDFVFSISSSRLKVNALSSLATDIAEVPLDSAEGETSTASN